MKKLYVGRCLFLLIITFLFITVNFAAYNSQPDYSAPMSFKFTLNETDIADTLDIIEQLETYIDNGKNFKIIKTSEELSDKMDYLSHQYLVGEMLYYADLEDEAAYERYVFSEDAYLTVCEESQRVLKKLYLSDLPSKKKVFADWTDAELRSLSVSNKEILDLEKEQNDLVREYLTLDNPESEEWSVALEKIYYEYVKASQQLARLNQYDNYYDYAANEIYMRKYTKEQRESFRQNVKEFILPFYIEIDSLYQSKKVLLNEEQKAFFLHYAKILVSHQTSILQDILTATPKI